MFIVLEIQEQVLYLEQDVKDTKEFEVTVAFMFLSRYSGTDTLAI